MPEGSRYNEGVFEDERGRSTFTEAGSIDDAIWAFANSPAVLLSITRTVCDPAAAAPMDEQIASSDASSVMDSVMVADTQSELDGDSNGGICLAAGLLITKRHNNSNDEIEREVATAMAM